MVNLKFVTGSNTGDLNKDKPMNNLLQVCEVYYTPYIPYPSTLTEFC